MITFLSVSLLLSVNESLIQANEKEELQVNEALSAMKKASDYMAETVSYNGGYLWAYKEDFSEVFGEVPARKSQIWVQAGTPQMGQTYLEMYEVTGDETYLKYAKNAADALVYGQHHLGGWHYFIDFDKPGLNKWYEEVASQFKRGWEEFRYYYGNCTFDDNVTQGATDFLLDLYVKTHDPTYLQPLLKALDFILMAQYPNGAWPQRYPLRYDYASDTGLPDYTSHYTLNDDAMNDIIKVLLKAYEVLGHEVYLEAALRGGEFFMIAQGPQEIPAWSEQYDRNMQPAWARTHEPPAYATRQTAHTLEMLMQLYLFTGDRRYLRPIPATLGWIASSTLDVLDNGLHELARYYEPETRLPIDLLVLDELSPMGKVRYHYFPNDEQPFPGRRQTVNYQQLKKDFEFVSNLKPGEERYWYYQWYREPESPDKPDFERIRQLISEINENGIWIEDISVHDTSVTMNPDPAYMTDPDFKKMIRGISLRTYMNNMKTFMDYIIHNTN